VHSRRSLVGWLGLPASVAALLLGAAPLAAQEDSVVVPSRGATPAAFVPKGYVVLAEASGSLDGAWRWSYVHRFR
jgi:hypothetical protein